MRTRVCGMSVFALAVALAPACAAGQLEIIDDSYAYRPEQTSYDPDTDVVVTAGEDRDFGGFWVAMQCSSDAMWRVNQFTGDWKPRETLPDDMKIFHDTICAGRGYLRYLAFRADDIPQPRY